MKVILLIIALILGAISAADQTIVSRPATNAFQAAAYDGQSGVTLINTCDSKLLLYLINTGDYVWYEGVDFGTTGTEAIEITFSSYQPVGYTGTVSVRLDSYNGPSIAEIVVGGTGTSCDFYTLTTFLKTVPTGVHNVYFYFTSPYTADLMYFYLFRFIETL